MGWGMCGQDEHGRDIGYMVPAFCDHPGCGAEINRGLGCVCGGMHGAAWGANEDGCGLYFCGKHGGGMLCERCGDYSLEMDDYNEEMKEVSDGDEEPEMPDYAGPFQPTFEHPLWLKHKLEDESWAKWRAENPAKVAEYKEKMGISECYALKPEYKEGDE